MSEIRLLRIILFWGSFYIIWDCFQKFPREYLHETNYFLWYVFSWSGVVIGLLMLVGITDISAVLQVDEFNVFEGLCLMVGASVIGTWETAKKKAILDYKYHGIKLGDEYKISIIRRNFVIVVEILMLAIIIGFHCFLLEV